MFGLSFAELAIILVVVLVLFGSSRLAGIGKAAGKSVREFKEEMHTDDNQEKKDNGVSETSNQDEN